MDTAITIRDGGLERVGAERAPSAAALSLAAVAAWGTGLLELALGAGMMTGAGGGAARGAGAALVILGAAGLGWGAATLARGRIVVPRAGVTGALRAPVIGRLGQAMAAIRHEASAVAPASSTMSPASYA